MTNDSQKEYELNAEVSIEDAGNPWPIVIIMLIICLTVLGVCWGFVYWLTNVPQ